MQYSKMLLSATAQVCDLSKQLQRVPRNSCRDLLGYDRELRAYVIFIRREGALAVERRKSELFSHFPTFLLVMDIYTIFSL